MKRLDWISIAIVGLFIVFFCGAIIRLMLQSPINTDELIAKDIQALQQIFKKIHQDCTIVQFDRDRNDIDFLTVEKFTGTEVGSMTVLYPNFWQGPYLKYNLMMQQEPYVIAKTLSGYYIIPGNGVTLNNGQILGKDIIIDKKTNMDKLLADSGALTSPSGLLAGKIQIGATLLQKMFAPTEGFKLYDIES